MPHTVRSLAEALDLSGEVRDAFVDVAPKRIGMAFSSTREPEEPALHSPPTPLVGRERDVVAVRSLLGESGARLVTLTGPGGVGKTRLAQEVAGWTGDGFPDGVTFVALAPVADPTLLVPTVAQVLGLRGAGEQPMRELVHGYLREKRMLLVLDNLGSTCSQPLPRWPNCSPPALP